MTRTLFTARTRGLEGLVRDASITERDVQREVRRGMARLGPTVLRVYRKLARFESGRMRDALYVKTYTFPGGGVQTRVGIGAVRDPVTGYDYLEQTRRGRGPIHAPGGMVLSLGRGKDGVPSSRFPADGSRLFSVRGWRPSVDWVEEAERRSRRHVTDTQREIGQGISRRGLLRSYGA